MNRNEEIIKMRGAGKSLRQLAKIFNVSYQRISQIIKNPNLSKPEIEYVCSLCKKTFLTFNGNSTRRYCSDCSKFNSHRGREATRMLVRIRDNFTCQDCGAIRTPEMAKMEHKRLFDIHHLNGLCGKLSRKYDRVGDMSGLITLCHKCHFNRPEHKSHNPAKRKTKLFDCIKCGLNFSAVWSLGICRNCQ